MISVIVPILNEKDNINKIITWIKAYSDVEFILVDGGSNDDSLLELKEKGIAVISSSKGRAIQMNKGAEHATGDILLFLHADCDIDEEHFIVIQKIVSQGYVGGAFCTKTIVDKKGIWQKLVRLADIQSYYNKIPYGDQGIFCTKQAFLQLGGYKNILIFEDYDFSKRLKNIGKIKISKPLIKVSGRRYLDWGIIKSFFIMKGLKFGYRLGIPPRKLYKFYKDVR